MTDPATTAPSRSWDIEAIRGQFPVLQQTLPKGLPVTYLDSASTAQKPQAVIDRESEVYEQFYANAYRGVYRFGSIVDELVEGVRDRIRQFLNAESADEIVFTSGTTMAINLVAGGWARRHLGPDDCILLNVMEHHANLVPWQMAAQHTGCQLRYLPLTADGRLDLDQLDQHLTPDVKLVAVTGMSNVLGTINPVRVLAERAHAVGARILVDGAQSAPHGDVDVRDEQIDWFAFSGHKLYGPSGVGVLYGRRELLEETDPLLGGGHMIDRVYTDHSTYAPPPAKFEAGTPPIAQIIALGTAVDFFQQWPTDIVRRHEHDVLEYAFERLPEIPGLKIHGPDLEHRAAIASFTVENAHPEDLAVLLDRRGVYVRHGHHCTMPLHDWLQVPATVRASFGLYSTREDVDRLLDAIQFARQRLRLT